MVDKLRSYELEPSKHLDIASFVKVSGALFEEPDVLSLCGSLRGLIFSTPYTSPAATPTSLSLSLSHSPSLKSLQSSYEAVMPQLNQKEACGVPLLGIFVASLATELNKITNNSGLFSADMEYPLVLDVVKNQERNLPVIQPLLLRVTRN